ncbi:ParB/RepB/Spo0J family partition protein [Streptomyces sp. NBC_00378]|uniref:ParB/RepB/Spo0J family partition protein n=1 Tax=unclassified Streptomyces TaxID=2593676 RepID=UPI00225233F4|nr:MULTISPECIES: ParB/RepB/Spo0J family partition protein [unclassified Streptomyces]MCX5115172.1 ParB/RepB/Spo0J family partition protein [Streptomyces sp. NBC_00378]
MKKSDALGASATFDAVSQPISSRAASFARYAGQGDDPTPAPSTEAQTASPRLDVTQLAHNPFNPREELKAVEDMADSLTARGVIQPLTVVTRVAFLSAHPGHDTELGSATHVVVDGNRRLAGANLAGLDDVPVHIDNSLAESADTLLETALTAAIQHESLDPLDEAKALERLVEVHGSQRAVARALGKSSPWVTQRLALLKLTPDLQQAVENKSLPVEVARNIGQLPPQQQHHAAEEALSARAERKQRRRGRGANAVSTPTKNTAAEPCANGGVSTPATREPDTGTPPAADETKRSDEAGMTTTDVDLPAPRKAVVKMPWQDGEKVADIVIEKMGEEQREVLLQRLIAARTVSGA